MHNIIYDKNKKTIVATISGTIGTEQASAMLSDFKRTINGLNVKEHMLIINPENISASLFVLPILQSFIQLVGQLNFKRIYLINSDKYAAVIKQSLNSNGVANTVQYAKSINEALSSR